MKECSVMIVLEALVELLIPYHAFVTSNIDYLEEERVPNHVLSQHHRPTNSCKVPFVLVWMIHVEPCNSDSDDVV